MNKPRTIVFLGKSGSGKDTQMELLAEKLQPHLLITTGDKFREVAELNTVAGRKINKLLEEGRLAPRWFAEYLWQGQLIYDLNDNEHLIFGGTPRRLEEAKRIDEVIEWLERSLPEAILLDIPDEESVRRIVKRGRDEDDNEENVRKRLEWFKETVEPVVEYYEKQGRLHRIDGVGAVEDIHQRIIDSLDIQ